ncbi:MAG: hypothetical protein IT562_02410 [Alphaproteobacteria bacterium]|nr:hypothetical protein [Alphaproteobacteria bacterium]
MLRELVARISGRAAWAGPAVQLSPYDALILWLLAVPPGVDYASAARAALETLPQPALSEDRVARFRELLGQVAAQGGAAEVARMARAIRRRRPDRKDA